MKVTVTSTPQKCLDLMDSQQQSRFKLSTEQTERSLILKNNGSVDIEISVGELPESFGQGLPVQAGEIISVQIREINNLWFVTSSTDNNDIRIINL